MQPVVVAVFAKRPVLGRVKTRLAADVGPEVALETAIALRDATMAAVRTVPRGVRPVLATVGPHPRMSGWEVWGQGSGDLGERIARILRRGCRVGAGAVALGADTAVPDPEAIAAAIDAIHRGVPALGRVEDGGFWLLAVPNVPRALLTRLPWSAPTTADAVHARLCAVWPEVVSVRSTFDVDTVEDWRRWRARGAGPC
jgi:glycosyltransferase A (GT-A) superfamily protein (DUF2064 family)